VLARSHVVLAVAPYLALLSHPLPSPAEGTGALPGAPVLQIPEGTVAADPVLAVALSVVVVAVAALLPDLDHGRGAIGRAGGMVGRVGTRTVQRLLGHRGPLHSVLAALAAGVAGALLGQALGLGNLGWLVAYGWGAHLLADAVTDGGVPLLWPVWRRRLRLPFRLGLKTGGSGEALVVVAGVVACLGWMALGLAV
jgi:membrane-bound metal-dependent hydrolase YbcI (DUF457 family)